MSRNCLRQFASGDVGARERRLSIMIGGDEEVVTRLLTPLFSCMAAKDQGGVISYMGGPGSESVNRSLVKRLFITA